MATSATYYLDYASLSGATSVYLNQAQTICAPDGFYSDGVIVREQVGCVLLPQQSCPSCATPCGGTINSGGNQGIYLINLNAGTSIGAVIVKFNPYSIPDGIRATFNSIIYNKLSSPVDGVHQSVFTDHFTYVGAYSDDCGISGTTYPSLTEYLYDGTSFNPTGNTQSITVNPSDVSLSSGSPGYCVMVIPKTTLSPSVINFEMVGPCTSGTSWDVQISCPSLLPTFNVSNSFPSASIPCGTAIDQSYFFAKVHTAADSYIGLYDYVFIDPYGSLPLSDGYYLTNNVAAPNKVLHVVNGVVVGITNCI